MRTFIISALLLLMCSIAIADEKQGVHKPLALDNLAATYGDIPNQFKEYDVILESPKDAAEYWAGAPSVLHDDMTRPI